MKQILKTTLIAGTLLSLGIAQAQQAAELAKHPGEVIKLEVKFDGPDGAKIITIYANLSTQTERPPDQAGFMNNFPGEFKLISPGLFEGDFKIPDTALSGDYKLQSMDVRAPGIQLTYNEGKQYNLHEFRIENKNKFVQPPITIKEVH
jgi:hypothetical protein